MGKQSWAIEGSGNPGSENQPDQTIYLEADQVDIDNKQKISTYQGNVKLSRGDIIILADKITAKKNKKGLGKLFATGNPVKFNKTQQRTGQNDSGQKEIKGQALEIEYDTEKEIMTLKNEAKLWQSNDQFSGNLIIYNIAQESVTANRGSAKNGRVQVIIHPGNNSSENKLRAND
ncbi:MAG: lipopolysaccharide transport periplasmic protein LptA [Gammaproteobacteria bacterium]|nr:lipopolysaccharide transport periplasmic protein LptA [Gammaproteobacteria bacterium]